MKRELKDWSKWPGIRAGGSNRDLPDEEGTERCSSLRSPPPSWTRNRDLPDEEGTERFGPTRR